MKKRVLSILIAIVMIVQLFPLTALAADDDFIDSIGDGFVNSGTFAEQTSSAQPLPEDYYIYPNRFETTENALKLRLINDMSQHNEEIILYYCTDHIVTDEEVLGWLDEVTIESPGNAYEGDYLLWSFDAATSAYGIFYRQDGSIYYNVIVFQLSFYSSSMQESNFHSKIRDIIYNLDFNNDSTSSEKMQIIYEHLCNSITVVSMNNAANTPSLNSAYSAIVSKKATPLGVAALTRLLLSEIGIYTRIVAGYVNGEPHFWNIARIDGVYYNIDISADCGKADYSHFFKGSNSFNDYERLYYYDSPAFHNEHPMSTSDYPFLPVVQGNIGNNITWHYYADRNTLIIRGTGRMPDFNGNAPWVQFKNTIECVEIKEGITYIGARAFEDFPNLIKVRTGSQVEEIGKYAFRNCSKLNTVSSIGYLRIIGDGAFMNCTQLFNCDNVLISTYLKTIGDDAFRNSGIENLTLPQGLENVGERAFMNCGNLNFIRILGYRTSPLTIKADVFSGTPVSSLRIPELSLVLKANAFRGSNFSEIIFEGNAPSIDSNSFNGVNTSIYYLKDKSGWTSVKDKNYAGNLTWQALSHGDIYCIGGIPTIISETPSTCQTQGTRTFEVNCYDCGRYLATYTEYSALAPHTDNDGNEACDWCGTRVCRTHTLVTIPGTAPTCTEPGSTDYIHCSACEYVQASSEPIPPTGHNYIGPVCENCGAISNPFVDVAEKDYFFEPVLWAVQKGITGGISATQFAPNNACTRGQVVTFLWRAAGSPEPQSTSHPFTDISESQYYYKAVLWAVENGITSGLTATTFGPNNACTRGQIATFLWRANGSPEPQSSNNPFSDVNAGPFYKAILWAVEEGITTGYAGGTFRPGNVCTRGNIVTFLYRAYN